MGSISLLGTKSTYSSDVSMTTSVAAISCHDVSIITSTATRHPGLTLALSGKNLISVAVPAPIIVVMIAIPKIIFFMIVADPK